MQQRVTNAINKYWKKYTSSHPQTRFNEAIFFCKSPNWDIKSATKCGCVYPKHNKRNPSRTADVSDRFTPLLIKLKPAKFGHKEKRKLKKKKTTTKKYSEKINNGSTSKRRKSTHFRLSEMTTRVQANLRYLLTIGMSPSSGAFVSLIEHRLIKPSTFTVMVNN